MDQYDIVPDVISGCAGGGSNLGGLISPFMGEKLRGERDSRFIAVEPASCPSLTRGRFAYDYCDTGMVCPLAKMYTLGSGFIPSASHSGGLRYHEMCIRDRETPMRRFPPPIMIWPRIFIMIFPGTMTPVP